MVDSFFLPVKICFKFFFFVWVIFLWVGNIDPPADTVIQLYYIIHKFSLGGYSNIFFKDIYSSINNVNILYCWVICVYCINLFDFILFAKNVNKRVSYLFFGGRVS